AETKTRRAKKQRTDRQDAQLLLKLLLEDRFPRIWVPSPENRDLRQLLWLRHRLVQMRTRIMNQLQALAMNENRCWKGKLWSQRGRAELEKLPLAFWASRRRQELLELLDRVNPTIAFRFRRDCKLCLVARRSLYRLLAGNRDPRRRADHELQVITCGMP